LNYNFSRVDDEMLKAVMSYKVTGSMRIKSEESFVFISKQPNQMSPLVAEASFLLFEQQ